MNNINEIITTLRDLGSPSRSAKSETMFPTSMEVTGVTSPELKLVMKELFNSMKGEGRDRFLSLSQELVNSRIMECQMLAWLLIEKAGIVPSLTKKELENLRGVTDNWASVDTYGVLIYGIAWRNGTISDRDVFRLQESDNVWLRRLALVATVSLNLRSRGGTGDAERTIAICSRAADDHHDMVVKALSWSLRSLIIWDRNAVEGFLKQYKSRVHKRVVREVRHKLDYGTKN